MSLRKHAAPCMVRDYPWKSRPFLGFRASRVHRPAREIAIHGLDPDALGRAGLACCKVGLDPTGGTVSRSVVLLRAIERRRERPIPFPPLRRGGRGGDAGALAIENDSSRLARVMRKD